MLEARVMKSIEERKARGTYLTFLNRNEIPLDAAQVLLKFFLMINRYNVQDVSSVMAMDAAIDSRVAGRMLTIHEYKIMMAKLFLKRPMFFFDNIIFWKERENYVRVYGFFQVVWPSGRRYVDAYSIHLARRFNQWLIIKTKYLPWKI